MAGSLSRYGTVFAAPGSRAFCSAAFVMRLPIAMYPIGIVLIMSAHSGRYGFAGVLAACYTIGGGIGMPLTAMLVDRFGQRRVLRPAAVAHTAVVALLAILLHEDAPDWSLVAPAVAIGLTYLSVGSIARARWSHALGDRPELATALSLESVLDELIFVVGPLVATLIATHTDPVIVLVVTLALVAGGSLWLASLRSTEPPVHPRDDGHPTALRTRGMVLLVLTAVPLGAVFATCEIAGIAYCGQHGHRGMSGVMIAALAAGSGVAGLVYGAHDHHTPVRDRFRRQALLFAVLPFSLFAVVDIPVLVVATAVVGLGIAPTLITAFELVRTLVPARSLTEGLAWVNTGLSVGYGIGSSIIGKIADAEGARASFAVVLGFALLVGALACMLHRRLRADASVPQPVVVAP